MEILNSHRLIQNCISTTQINIGRSVKTFSHLSVNQLNWKFHPDSWSVGECFSHLINANNLYLNKFQSILNLHQSENEEDFVYTQSFFGRRIAIGVDPDNVKKSKTFKVFFPATSNMKKDIIEDYIKSSEKLITLAEKMLHLDLKKLKLSSPVNFLIRLNLGDPLIIIPKHDERLLNQAERVKNQKDFPKN
jgi:hypothetical protein